MLVLPSSDREESIRVLRERRAPLVFDGFDLDAYAWNLRRPVRRVDGQLGEPPVRRVTAAIALSSL